MVLCRDRLYVYGGMSGAGLTTEMWWFDLSISSSKIIIRKIGMEFLSSR